MYHIRITELFLNKTRNPEATIGRHINYTKMKHSLNEKGNFVESTIMLTNSNFYTFILFLTSKVLISQVAEILLELRFKVERCKWWKVWNLIEEPKISPKQMKRHTILLLKEPWYEISKNVNSFKVNIKSSVQFQLESKKRV